jgi:hypothetical protein
MRRQSRVFFLGSRLFALGAGILVVVMLCAGLALAFTDVSPGDDYSEAIAQLSSLKIIEGFESDNTFRPRDLVTRQQFAKMVVLTLGLTVTENDICPFPDVQRSDASTLYPDNYVAVCARNSITVGKEKDGITIFDPYSNITRAQVMSMVVRAAPLAGVTLNQPTSAYYADSKYIMRGFNDPDHGLNAQIAELSGLLWGIRLDSAGFWDPWKKATRGEVAQILWRLRQKMTPATTTTTTEPPPSNLLAYDDFSDPSSGWGVATYSNSTVGYSDAVGGTYRIGITAADIAIGSWYIQQLFDDAYYEAWAWPSDPAASGSPESGSWEYGLVFRLQDLNNLYELSVMGDDTARLWKRVSGQWTQMSTLVDLGPVPAGNNGWRHLEVLMLGDSFQAWVDDIYIGDFTDSTFATGKVGFYVGTFDSTNFATFFDEFAVWRLVY